jgi:hypothetical protein
MEVPQLDARLALEVLLLQAGRESVPLLTRQEVAEVELFKSSGRAPLLGADAASLFTHIGESLPSDFASLLRVVGDTVRR